MGSVGPDIAGADVVPVLANLVRAADFDRRAGGSGVWVLPLDAGGAPRCRFRRARGQDVLTGGPPLRGGPRIPASERRATPSGRTTAAASCPAPGPCQS